ncbi:MAG: hypothetical protein Q7S34_00915 [bacterium]|nr:hypothetical protein [bacterium]
METPYIVEFPPNLHLSKAVHVAFVMNNLKFFKGGKLIISEIRDSQCRLQLVFVTNAQKEFFDQSLKCGDCQAIARYLSNPPADPINEDLKLRMDASG